MDNDDVVNSSYLSSSLSWAQRVWCKQRRQLDIDVPPDNQWQFALRHLGILFSAKLTVASDAVVDVFIE